MCDERILSQEDETEAKEMVQVLSRLPRDSKLKVIGYGSALLTESTATQVNTCKQ